jgi:hypothetical protein
MSGGWPVVDLGSAKIVNPIGKAFKRVELGPTESVPDLHDALVARSGAPRARRTELTMGTFGR